MSKELWKPVTSFGDGKLLEVSSRARVRCLVTRKLHRPVVTKDEYQVVRVLIDGAYRSMTLHRLVAMTFLPGAPTTPVIFKNGDRSNCRLSNLRWANASDSWAIRNRKLSDEQIILIRQKKGRVLQRRLAQKFGVCRQTISQVASGRTFVGPKWTPPPAPTSRVRKRSRSCR